MSSREAIKVITRIRPENHLELGGGYKRCVTYDDTNISVQVIF